MQLRTDAITAANKEIVESARWCRFPRWIWVGSVALMTLCYAPVLKTMVQQWRLDEDMSYGFFVPLIVGFIVWQRREALLAVPTSTNRWGLLFLVWSAVQLWLGMLTGATFAQQAAFLISLFGMTLYFGGSQFLRVLAFPLFLLCFMVPIPRGVYQAFAHPLQLLAARLAADLLRMVGLPVYREGTVLELAGRSLSVLDGCSGMHSLISLSFFGLAWAYLLKLKAGARFLILVVSLQVALLANALRIVAIGMLGELHGLGLHERARLAGPALHNLYHSSSHAALGAITFGAAIGVLVLLNKLFTVRRVAMLPKPLRTSTAPVLRD